jgi:hypothetical protein
MDHHEQHHQHHQKEREEHKKHHHEQELKEEKKIGIVGPRWFVIAGIILILGVVLTWTIIASL